MKRLFAILLSLSLFQLWTMSEKEIEVQKLREKFFESSRKAAEIKYARKNVKIDWDNIEYHIENSCKDDPNYQDTYKNTLIHYAVKNDRFDMVKFLVKNYKLDLNLKNDKEKTPLDIALKGKSVPDEEQQRKERYGERKVYKIVKNEELIKFLKDKGARTNLSNIGEE